MEISSSNFTLNQPNENPNFWGPPVNNLHSYGNQLRWSVTPWNDSHI